MKTNTVSKVMQKKAELEYIEQLLRQLENERKYAASRYQQVGFTDEQEKNWKTGELIWEDDEHTIPKYVKAYDYVDIADEDLTDEERAKIQAIDKLSDYLEKLI